MRPITAGELRLRTFGAAMWHRPVTMLRQVRMIPTAESVLLMGVSVGLSFVIVFMIGPALGEMMKMIAS